MPRFKFSVRTSEGSQEAGFVQGGSFGDALAAIGKRIDVDEGAILEIGVDGFPPARYEYVWPGADGYPSWQPTWRPAAA